MLSLSRSIRARFCASMACLELAELLHLDTHGELARLCLAALAGGLRASLRAAALVQDALLVRPGASSSCNRSAVSSCSTWAFCACLLRELLVLLHPASAACFCRRGACSACARRAASCSASLRSFSAAACAWASACACSSAACFAAPPHSTRCRDCAASRSARSRASSRLLSCAPGSFGLAAGFSSTLCSCWRVCCSSCSFCCTARRRLLLRLQPLQVTSSPAAHRTDSCSALAQRSASSTPSLEPLHLLQRPSAAVQLLLSCQTLLHTLLSLPAPLSSAASCRCRCLLLCLLLASCPLRCRGCAPAPNSSSALPAAFLATP